MVALEIFLNGYKVIFSSRQCPLQIQSWFSCHLQSISIDCVSRKQKIRGFLLLNIYSFHTATSRPVKTCTPDISQISTCPSSPNLLYSTLLCHPPPLSPTQHPHHCCTNSPSSEYPSLFMNTFLDTDNSIVCLICPQYVIYHSKDRSHALLISVPFDWPMKLYFV